MFKTILSSVKNYSKYFIFLLIGAFLAVTLSTYAAFTSWDTAKIGVENQLTTEKWNEVVDGLAQMDAKIDALSTGGTGGGSPDTWACTLVQGPNTTTGTSLAPCDSKKLITGGCVLNGALTGNRPDNNGWRCTSTLGNPQAYAWCCE